MWRILKAELSYNKLMLFIAYGLVIFLKFGTIYQEIISSLIIAFISIGIMGSESDKERRERLHVLLPIPIRKISFARLLFLIIFQSVMFILWMTTSAFETVENNQLVIWIMLTANALFLILINLLIIYTDLGFYLNKSWRYIFWGIVFLLVPVSAWLVYNGHLLLFLRGDAQTSSIILETLVYNFICLGFFYSSYKIFIARKSYLK